VGLIPKAYRIFPTSS